MVDTTTTFEAKKISEREEEGKKVEVYHIDIKLSQGDKQRFMNNPNEFMKEQMERNGLKVRSVDGDKEALVGTIVKGDEASFEWVHFVYPEELRSQWRYVYTPGSPPQPF